MSNTLYNVYTGCFFISTLFEVPYLPLKLSDSYKLSGFTHLHEMRKLVKKLVISSNRYFNMKNSRQEILGFSLFPHRPNHTFQHTSTYSAISITC